MGGEEFSRKYLEKLEEDLKASFESFSRHNESKNFFSSFRTPATLFVIIVFFYVISGILDLIGLVRYGNFFTVAMGLVIASVVAWGAARLTGSMREVGTTVDEVATGIWDHVLSPLTQQAGQKMATAYPQYSHMAAVGVESLTAAAKGVKNGRHPSGAGNL